MMVPTERRLADLPSSRLVRPTAGGSLEVFASLPPGAGPSTPGVLLVPPHPLLGGDADNNVVVALARGALARGWAALRFNYRGVGGSLVDGPALPRYERFAAIERTGDVGALVADARAAFAIARRLFRVVGLVGYSFGAAAAAPLAADEPALAFVGLCPPVGKQDLSALAGREALLVFAGADACVPPPPEDDLRRRFPRARAVVLPRLDHFALGQEERLVRPALEHLAAFAITDPEFYPQETAS